MDYVIAKNKMFTENCLRFQSEQFSMFPSPKLIISYEDIAGKKYDSTYKFKLSCLNSFSQMNGQYIDTSKEYAFLNFHAIQ